MRKRLHTVERRTPGTQAAPIVQPPDHLHVLRRMNLDLKLDKKAYGRKLEKLQRRLALATRHNHFRDHSVVCVFEGVDAAGKGGAIRRVTAALDARLYHTIPTAAPSDEERAQPYLWRFWRHAPRDGKVIIFDIDEALSFEGESGPYLQYAAVRAGNILQKLEERHGTAAASIGAALQQAPPDHAQTAGPQHGMATQMCFTREMVERTKEAEQQLNAANQETQSLRMRLAEVEEEARSDPLIDLIGYAERYRPSSPSYRLAKNHSTQSFTTPGRSRPPRGAAP